MAKAAVKAAKKKPEAPAEARPEAALTAAEKTDALETARADKAERGSAASVREIAAARQAAKDAAFKAEAETVREATKAYDETVAEAVKVLSAVKENAAAARKVAVADADAADFTIPAASLTFPCTKFKKNPLKPNGYEARRVNSAADAAKLGAGWKDSPDDV